MKKYGLVRTNAAFRDQFIDVCKRHYLTMSDVIRAYIHMCVDKNKIVYCDPVTQYSESAVDLDKGMAFWIDDDVYDRFVQLAKPSVSFVIRGYMSYCIRNDIPNPCNGYSGALLCGPDDVATMLSEQLSVLDNTKAAAVLGDMSTVVEQLTAVESSMRMMLSMLR